MSWPRLEKGKPIGHETVVVERGPQDEALELRRGDREPGTAALRRRARVEAADDRLPALWVARLGAAAELHLAATTDEEAREHVPSGDGIRILLNGPGSAPELRMVPSVKFRLTLDVACSAEA
jgi:hypothetical protein